MKKFKLILASASPARKSLLEKLQIPFDVVPAHIDETPHDNETPKSLAKRLAIEKAEKVAAQIADTSAYIIGADQVIMYNNIRLDKPLTIQNAHQQLSLVSGKSVISYTGLCLWNTETKTHHCDVETCEVTFRTLSEEQIKHYVERDNPLHCAGSIKAEGLGITLLNAILCRDESALVGLPLMLLTDFLLAQGVLE